MASTDELQRAATQINRTAERATATLQRANERSLSSQGQLQRNVSAANGTAARATAQIQRNDAYTVRSAQAAALNRLLPPLESPDIFRYKKGRVDDISAPEDNLQKTTTKDNSSQSIDHLKAQPSSARVGKQTRLTGKSSNTGVAKSGANRENSKQGSSNTGQKLQRGKNSLPPPAPRKDRNYRKGKVYQKGTGFSAKAKAIGLAIKAPEVMIKFDKASTGIKSQHHLSEALDYIARNGLLDVVDSDGNKLDRAERRNLIEEWCDDQNVPKSEAEITGRRAADARRMIISCPAGTDPEKVMIAAQQFGQEFFKDNGFDYVCALHCRSSEHPNEPEHPHVHFIIKTINQDEQRLNVRKNDLKFMRERFAAIAKEHGIIMNATPRAVRGKTEKAKPLEQVHQERREAATVKSNDQAPAKHPYKEARDQELRSALAANQPPAAHEVLQKTKQTREMVLQNAEAVIAELNKSGDKGDRALAAGLKKHFDEVPPVQSAQQRRYNAVKSFIAQKKREKAERQAAEAAAKAKAAIAARAKAKDHTADAKQSQAQKWAIHNKKKQRSMER